MFANKIDEVRSFIIKQTKSRCTPHWNWLCVKIASLLSKYPSGITKTIILAEVQNSWSNVNQLQGYNESFKKRKVSLDSVIEGKHIGHDSIIEVKVVSIKNVPGTNTKLAVLTNSGESSHEGRKSIEMYVHQKLYEIEGVILKNMLRFTGCRLWKSGNTQNARLLPSANMVILLEGSQSSWVDKEFNSLQNISYEGTQPHYDASVKVEVVDVGDEEIIHLASGETSVKRTVTVVDHSDIHAHFCLWDDQLPMGDLFKSGDILAIWNPFIVPCPEQGFILEYGPATIVYCLLCDTSHEMVLSQVSKCTPVSVAKDSHGNLDYSMYPERIYIADFKSKMMNVTIIAQIVSVLPKENFKLDHHYGHVYNLVVTDGTESFDLKVYDHLKCYHESLYPGQCVVFENLYSSGQSACTEMSLKTWASGRIWNMSALSGWLASKYLATNITSINDINNHDNCISKAVVTGVIGYESGKFVKKVHMSCLGDIDDMAGDCLKCGEFPSHELPHQHDIELQSLSKYWKWQYSVSIDVHDANTSARLNLTTQSAQELLQMSIQQFVAQPLSVRGKVLESVLANVYIFGISTTREQVSQVDAIFISV